MNLLIKNAYVVDESHNFNGDVYIENGKIKELGQGLIKECETIDAKGLTLMPAFIDLHVHFREPGFTYKEDIETGSKAALRGGFTFVNLMGNTNPICSTKEVWNGINKRVKEVGLIDVHQCVTITKNFDGKTISHLEEFKNENLRAITDDGKGVTDGRAMLEVLKLSKDKKWVVMSHAESAEFSDLDMRLAENMMTFRDVELAKYTGGNLHMAHVSTIEALQCIIDAKNEGVNVTCEVTPHHICLNSSISNYRVNPPIREKEDVNFIINSIKKGYVDCISTDHAPHSKEDKEKGCPGMIGLETAFPISYTVLVKENNISLNKLSEIMSGNPGRILRLNKGKISPGYDGDLVLVDLNKERQITEDEFVSKSNNSPFIGMKFFGEIVKTIKNGKIMYNN